MARMAAFGSKLKHAWNAFTGQDWAQTYPNLGPSYGFRPDRRRSYISNERSIISSIYTRLSLDVAGVDIRHVRVDDDDRYLNDIDSGLNTCLTLEANIDQGARHFRQDVASTLFDRGVIAIVPVDTTIDPSVSGSFDIQSLRVGEIVDWFPEHVSVNLFNEAKGIREQITLAKKFVAIVENPFYSIMNEPNSTLRRLIHKLNLLDVIDEQSSSGKLDLIIQLPYVIKSDARRDQAEKRRKAIEDQLQGSKYGIAYTDGTEKVTQLNRPAENNLMGQIEYLMKLLYSQLGLTEEILNGTADEKTMLNYNQRTIKPILDSIVEAMRRTFLTKTARSQKQTISYYRDPFELVPMEQLAEIADKFTRNEILTANEIRQGIGFKPSKDPKADKLVNSNMPQGVVDPAASSSGLPPDNSSGSSGDQLVQDGLDSLNLTIDQIFQELGIDENALPG